MPPFELSCWSQDARAQLGGVLTDIDDTLTTEGAITPDALGALHQLRAAGLPVFAITGRPAGWSEAFALAWPVNAIVAENGAVALWRGESGELRKAYAQDEATRRHNLERLHTVARHILHTLPITRLATDSPGRETDIAIDHSEFAHLGEAEIAQVVRIMKSQGLNATVSSIHINGWIGAHNKWVGARWIARELFGIDDLAAQQHRWLYIGDSTNDQVMFEHFTHSVGVANIARFAGQLPTPPRYVTEGERGAGFAEMTALLLAQRHGD